MKQNLTLAASLFAIAAVFSLNAGAASDTPADIKVEKAAAQKKMRPHSHMEEKTGFAQKAPEAMLDNSNAVNDKTKHFHPRDGK